MVTWVSAVVFAAALVGMWAWVGFQRRHAHVKRQRDRIEEGES